MFRNRQDAGQQLALRLDHLQGTTPLVLGILRGGVPVAYEVARVLRGNLGMIWVKKIGAPDNPEYAWAAVADQGEIVTAPRRPVREDEADYLRLQSRRRLRELDDWDKRFGPRTSLDLCRQRVVVVVDDGIATGASMKAALLRIRSADPSRLIAAVPVAPGDSLRTLAEAADEVIAALIPPGFHAVGAYYADFRAVSDEEVAAYLQKPLP
ncbi:MAG: phosphoribosyltransferase family protein [Thermaerobacter sp.]|nr:phosphoribosyltransferase family protein [Thermaerobacter sp.]